MSNTKKFYDIVFTEKNINEFVQKLPLAVTVINREREIVAYNRAFRLMAGRELRSGVRHCYEFLNFPFCQNDCLAHMATKLGRTITWDESRGQRKDGEELFVRPTVVPYYDEAAEEVLGHVLIFQNTTDEVQLYRNFRANLELLERKVDFLQTLNAAADKFRKITHVEELIKEIAEFAVENLSIECAQFILQVENKTSFKAMKTCTNNESSSIEASDKDLMASVMDTMKAIQKEEAAPYIVKKYEEDSPSPAGQIESVILPIHKESGIYGFLAIHHFKEPFTKEHLEYLELFAKSIGPYIENCHIISNLETIVADRSSQLQAAQAQLTESVRLASVGEIAGMVAHEVLNPMTAVMARIRKMQDEEDGNAGMVGLIVGDWTKDFNEGGLEKLFANLKDVPEGSDVTLLEEDLTNLQESVDDMGSDLRFVEEQLQRIVGIVDNLRGLSRAQNIAQSVDVAEAVTKTRELTHDAMSKRKILWKQELKHSSNVSCDPNELIQVIHNLARNAIQAIERRGTVTITTSETAERVEIRVQDSGPGIPAEIEGKIFEMRFTTKTQAEGTGLGLNLSRRLMRQVMGDVELESPGGNGEGATFLCWLPLEK